MAVVKSRAKRPGVADCPVNFRIDRETLAELKAVAEEEERTMGYLFRRALSEYLERRRRVLRGAPGHAV